MNAATSSGSGIATPATQPTTQARFSVLIPAYNRGDCVRETIDSVLAQSFTGYELIVINDGSSDRTQDVLDSYGERIKAIQQGHQGPEVARNRGASQAGGEYLALLDSDDLFLPWTLATYEKIIRAFDSPPLIIGSMAYFASGEAIPANSGHADVIEVLKYRDFLSKDVATGMSSSRIVIRKSVFEQIGGLRNSTPATFHADDYNLLLRAGTAGPCVVVLQPTMVAFRVHAKNTMGNVDAMVQGVLSLVDDERQGKYPGGASRRFERRACIGGVVWRWVERALKSRRPELAVKLLARSGPMVMAGALRKLWLRLRGATPAVRLCA